MSTTMDFDGNLKGLSLRIICWSHELPEGFSAIDKTLEEGVLLGVLGDKDVLGVFSEVVRWTFCPGVSGDFVGVLYGL